MVEKAKIFYFSVFILAVFAFVFHVTAMGHQHWKRATATANASNITTIGLFTRCIPSPDVKSETCSPNLYPRNTACYWTDCLRYDTGDCQCDYTPSTKGIASCAIIAAILLGLAIIILFIHSINTSETRSVGLVLGFFPLILLLLTFIFILIALILVGCYLSRDIMEQYRRQFGDDLSVLREQAKANYAIRVDWATGLEIIALFFSFLSLVLYGVFVFKLGRSASS